MDLRAIQKPLKDKYRNEPNAARVTLRAKCGETDTPLTCSVDLGHAAYAAAAHPGVGGTASAACSGDLLLGALAACAQITCQMVATAMGIPIRHVAVSVEGDLDLRGTLGVTRDVPVGFEQIRIKFDVDAPEATAEQIAGLRERTERYCVVMQTLVTPPPIDVQW